MVLYSNAGETREGSWFTVEFDQRERIILVRMAQGKTLDAIRKELGLSPKTFYNILKPLFKKIGASDRAEAVARAFRRKIYTPRECLIMDGPKHNLCILDLVAQRFTDTEIAQKLGRSVQEITQYINQSRGELGGVSRQEITNMVQKEGPFAA